MNVFRDLVKLRKSPSFQWGKLEVLLANDKVFAFVRRAFGFPVFLVAMNFSDSLTTVDLLLNNNIAPRAYVAYYMPGNIANHDTSNLNGFVDDCNYKLKSPVLTKSVTLKPRDGLVLTWPHSD